VIAEAKQSRRIEVHGNASVEGPAGDYNFNLACKRAVAVADQFRSAGVSAPITLFTHGPTSAYGDTPANRNVVVLLTAPATEQATVCGPDATDWFIRQVDAAKRAPIVLAIQANLAGAHRVAARNGFSAEAVAEGGVARKVLAEEARAGSPPRTAEAGSQLSTSVPSQAQFGRALAAATAPLPFVGAPEQLVLLAIRRSAHAWKALVGTGRRYDFKNDASTMKGPTSAHCPVNCANTITLCPGSGSDCFRTDVPGNLFYAHVGRFVGWTELSLQFGSEFAQLESTKTWDPPEDTRMISIGFALPHPLTTAALCASLSTNRSSFTQVPCSNCPEPTSAVIK